MRDQAEKLRILARTIKNQVESEIKGNGKKTRIIAVTSGKGGVGKTNFTINFALSLMAYGQKVIVLDADLGLANIDVILGISPKYNLYHVLKGEKTIQEIIVPGPQGLQIIAGGSGIQELANLRRWQVEQFIAKLGELEGLADILIIDTAAGLSRNVMSFVLAADEVIVITTPEPTAITDAYGLVKVMTTKKKNGVIHLVVNKVENAREADVTATKLSIVAEKFLKLNIGSLGFILDDPSVSKAVKSQEPFVLKYPKSPATACVQKLAAQLMEQEYAEPSGIKSFFNRLSNFFG
ncbi:Cobyrinic acid ac-diamide synthase [Thermincola ferriacetica]|uniref:Cobyrinic acid ac-diamide synthase n=2 Tax=Thermincola TaxID=278993 RepID=D5XFF2_THEPJ|nr:MULTISPECIES: MinD/ParA family protein [Thermincola]ADG82373.1 Cobyrinic acid ac-diamide synthase [Thermincola potens JR]KNZ70866.1 Cobyrinic acid ac-diamide synthase [Thermincola ferriacetica]